MLIKQLPITVPGGRKSDVRTQFAALCYRIKEKKVQVLMITSRGSQRWIIPKGWPINGKTPAGSAVQEAWEEAGVKGRSDGRCLGLYSYTKVDGEDEDLPCVAMVYAVAVRSLEKRYPEAGQRKRKWVSRKQAAKMVDEPELARILMDFDPRLTS